jgi:hypothetical protein
MKTHIMRLEDIVDAILFLIKVTFAAGIATLVLMVLSKIFRSKDHEE